MIKKILKIKSVGRFKSFSSSNDDLSFDKTTIIFGYNTHGKSTITSIFRSLKENNSHYINGRKTFGTSENQEIEILDSNHTKFIFNSSWENKNIEIFDNDFISKNVFYGDYINKEQQASLYGILIGDEVYTLKQKIDKEKEEQDKLSKEKDTIVNRFTRKDLGTFDEFLKLSEDSDIDNKIKEIQDKIKQQENIESLKLLISNTVLKSTFTNFKAEFIKTLDLSVEKTVSSHIEKNWKDTATSRDFLAKGLELLKEDGGCSFCGQDLSSVNSFILDLKKVFSDEYKNLKESIKTFGNNFILIDLEKIFLEFEKYGLALKDKLDYNNLLVFKSNIDKKILLKQDDLNLKLDFDKDVDFKSFLEELEKLSNFFGDILIQPSDDTFKIKLLKNGLKQNELIKYRFEPESVLIFNDHNDIKEKIDSKKEEIKKLNEMLAEKVNEAFKENEKQINNFLHKLGANFALKDFTPKSHMGRTDTHFCDFRFVIDNIHTFPVSNKTRKDEPEPENKPHFKNTLSDSDKRLLAFAFYLSRLSNDSNLKDKIIVLDDPFSSFDENRKEETINLINNIKNNKGDEPAQKIILTHDISFLCRLFNKLPKESKILKICYSLMDGSFLEVCDVENDFIKDSYFRDIEYIKNSVENSINVDEALKKVRPSLEHLLKRKYYFLLSTETLRKKSVGEYLNEIGSSCVIKDELLSENWHEDMHDGHSVMSLNEPAKVNKLGRFLELIKKI